MSFIVKRTVDESLNVVERVALQCQRNGGPLTNQLYNLLQEGRYVDVSNFKFDYTWSFSKDDFLYARQIQSLVSKQDFLDFGIDKEEVAFQKFLASEQLCQETNERIRTHASLDNDVAAVFHHAQRKIAQMLGSVPSLDSLELTFGPGATTSTKSFVANPRVKLANRLECSKSLLLIVPALLAELPAISAFNTNPETGKVKVTLASGKLAFVPKSSKEDRSIVVEPVLNGLIQKGIGSYMKTIFKKKGLDLTDQSRNQKLACIGSIDGSLATVDLSSASDTISYALVWDLLPYDWASLLDACRSESVTYKGKTYILEKFSSMGNAFTFELESLIFYSIAHSVCFHLGLDTSLVNTFGDDIILPTEGYPLLEKCLSWAGFVVNRDKSYASGPFRESCGADYLGGFDIRPYYLREKVSESTLYTMHNFFIRNCERKLAEAVKEFIREDIALYGPDGYGDGHLIGDYVPRLNRKYKRDGYGGGSFDTYTMVPNSYRKLLPSDYIFPCYSIYARGSSDPFESAGSDDGNTVRGYSTYSKISVYTLDTRIFKPAFEERNPHFQGKKTSTRRTCHFVGRQSKSFRVRGMRYGLIFFGPYNNDPSKG